MFESLNPFNSENAQKGKDLFGNLFKSNPAPAPAPAPILSHSPIQAPISVGGKRKRKTKKGKTNKRKTNKRKTKKGKTNKRK